MRPTRALIHTDFLLNNLALIRKGLAPGVEVCAAVKAQAYGHGAVNVVRALVDAGVESFGVATVDEGQELRLAGVDRPIYLLGTLQSDELAQAVSLDLDLFVWSPEAVHELAREATAQARHVRVHLKVDTGMGRVGCRPEDAVGVAQAIVHSLPLQLTGVCTHFASSDGPSTVVSVEAQMRLFDQTLSAIRDRGWNPRIVHAANSGAVAAWPSTQFNLVRPGIALYGYPAPGAFEAESYRPVMEWISRVGFVKTVPQGTALSYGSRYVTTRSTDVATIPVGYADGYRRSWTNRAPVWIKGRNYQVSGTVCMDQFMVDLGPQSEVKAGDPVVLMGPPSQAEGDSPPSASELAQLSDTISYEILCGVSSRVPRVLASANSSRASS